MEKENKKMDARASGGHQQLTSIKRPGTNIHSLYPKKKQGWEEEAKCKEQNAEILRPASNHAGRKNSAQNGRPDRLREFLSHLGQGAAELTHRVALGGIDDTEFVAPAEAVFDGADTRSQAVERSDHPRHGGTPGHEGGAVLNREELESSCGAQGLIHVILHVETHFDRPAVGASDESV